MSRPAVVFSILAHLALLYGASRFYEAAPLQIPVAFEWVPAFEPPAEPPPPVVPAAVEPPVSVVAPAPPPRGAAPRAIPPAVIAPPPVEAPAETLPAPPAGPSRLDLDAARRAAAAAVVEQHARDGMVRAPSVDDVPPPEPAAPKQPSIFDPQQHSGGGFLSPSKTRTVVGQRLSLWCNKVSGGGFGFFGIPVCVSGSIEPPSGILADSIPEYMKLKPECEGEKCRLVPIDEPASRRVSGDK
jgi:hypothetical protein